MASFADIPAGRSVRNAFASIGLQITEGFSAISRAHHLSSQMDAIMQLSDAQLADLGRTREELVREVIKDRLI